ncbi:MAG TPA: SymE family type I addiction module toxin [Rhodanobacteraceae bacterium]
MTSRTDVRRRPPHQTVCWIPRDEREVASRSAGASIVPSIALSGAWLRRAGFAPGARFLIMVQCRGQLIIERLR